MRQKKICIMFPQVAESHTLWPTMHAVWPGNPVAQSTTGPSSLCSWIQNFPKFMKFVQAIFPQSLDLYKIKILQKKIREIITLSYRNVSYCIVYFLNNVLVTPCQECECWIVWHYQQFSLAYFSSVKWATKLTRAWFTALKH